MNLIRNADWVRRRYDEFWHRENHDRPLLTIQVPRRNAPPPPPAPGDAQARWLDFGYVIKKARYQAENAYYTAETVPAYWPNLGPDIFAALLGCPLHFSSDTSWSHPIVEDWSAFDAYAIDPANEWYQRLVELTRLAVEDARGDYVVGLTDLHPGADALTALRGPDNLCIDLMDEPEQVRQAAMKLLAPLKEIYTTLYDLTKENNGGGTTNWMTTYGNGPWYVTSCDFCTMISGDQFEEFVAPELEAELAFFGDSIFHLDGAGAFRHLDRLLQMDQLKGVQLVPGDAEKPIYACGEEMRKIQGSGKLLQFYGQPADILKACDLIEPEGVHILTFADTPDEADALVREVERRFRDR